MLHVDADAWDAGRSCNVDQPLGYRRGRASDWEAPVRVQRRAIARGGFAALSLLSGWACQGEIRLPHMLSQHAVLQRERPIHIWGWSSPGEAVRIGFHAQTVLAKANDLGEFSGWLMPERAGGPYTLTVSGSGRDSPVVVGDLLVGDVWFASGQSNMEMPLRGFPGQAVVKDAEHEIATSLQPQIRLLRFEHRASDIPVEDVSAVWSTCEPGTAAEFSAVAYFFGRELAEREHVPIGLIDSTWGGTPIDSWMSLQSIASDASLMPVFSARSHFAAHQAALDNTIAAEKREDAAARAEKRPLPQHPWHPDQRSWTPSLLYNGMIAPATSYTIRGFLWYQGETDSSPERSPLYAKLFPTLIRGWRDSWAEGALPFLYVQISSFDSPAEIWGDVRDAQRRTLSVTNTAMAVSLDVGEEKNVHPPDKQTVAHRLALGARALSYGEAVEWSGPLYRETTADGSSLRVWFDHAGGGLRQSRSITGFEVAGEDGRFVPAEAVVAGESVAVHAAGVAHPRQVRYGWANVSRANLYNQQGLPASTFLADAP